MSPARRKAAPQSLPPVEAAPVFAALGDNTRLMIVGRLAAGPELSIADLTEHTRLSRQAVTRHLNVLAEAGLVQESWRGREHVWRLERARLALARRSLDHISAWWDDKLEELRASLEE